MLKTAYSVKKSEPIVTHVTEVKISLAYDHGVLKKRNAGHEAVTQSMVVEAGKNILSHYERVALMMDLLERHGFTLRMGKNAVYCFSDEVEAKTAKRLLLDAGFKDRDFQITLVYTRGWGML